MHAYAKLGSAVLSMFLLASPAVAQDRPVELGVDAGITITTGDPSTTAIQFPIQNVRVGFPISESVNLEPSLAFRRFSGGGTFTSMVLGLGAVWHLTANTTGRQTYLRPFASLNRTSSGGSSTQTSVGAGIGWKLPKSDSFGWRVELNVQHAMESESGADDDFTAFGGTFGFSVNLP